MTNRIALILGALLLLGLAVDYVLLGNDGTAFLARKFIALVEYVAFWR